MLTYNKFNHRIVKSNGDEKIVTVDQERDLRCKYPWRSMRPGDSFALPNTHRVRTNLYSAAHNRWTQHLESYQVYQSDDKQQIICERMA